MARPARFSFKEAVVFNKQGSWVTGSLFNSSIMFYTQQELLDNLTEEQWRKIHHGVSLYTQEIDNCNDKFHALKRMFRAVDQENEKIPPDVKAKIPCKKGCAFCCNIRIAATPVEAELAVSYAKQKNISIDTNKLRALKDLSEQEYILSPHKRCVFLADDNACKIYPVRPFACRNYFVTNDPEDCNVETNPKGGTISFMNMPANLPIIAFMNRYGLSSFPKELLKALTK